MSTNQVRNRRLGIAAAILMSAIALAGCAGSDGAQSEVAGAPAMAAGEAMPMMDTVTSDGTAPVPTTREVIRTGYVNMRVENVKESVTKVHALVDAAGGVIAGEDASGSGDAGGGGITHANITAQVPADRLDAFIADVSALGVVDNVSVNAQDVTQQGVDLDARIAALNTSIDRLNELLTQAQQVEDLVAIESELSARQAELDSLVAQRTWLSQQVAMSSVTISLAPITTIADVEMPGFLSGLESGWSALVALAKFSLTAAGFLLPFIVIIAVIVIPLTIWLVRRGHKRKQGGSQA